MSSLQHSSRSTPILLPSRYNINGDRTTNELSNEQIDLWENASVLYHGYEWQDAADEFYKLAQSIESIERRTLCLLNAGLIQARLGAYEAANVTFKEATKIDQTFVITAFLVGINCYELRDIAKAEACLEMCLNGLAYGPVDHLDVGMDFVLDKPAVRENLRNIRNAQFNCRFVKIIVSDLAPLNTIPAECIFEAPPRMVQVSSKSPQSEEPQGFRKMFGGRRSEVFKSPTSFKTDRSDTSSSASMESIPVLWRPPTCPTTSPSGNKLLSIPEDSDAVSPGLANPAILSTSAPTPGRTVERSRMSWHRRPTTPYTPRDAGGEHVSTKELTRFIRAGGKGKYWHLTPKDAKGEYESTGELAHFVVSYDPEDTGESALVKPYILDPYSSTTLRQNHQFKQADDQVRHGQGNDTPTSSNIAESPLNAPRRNSAPASPQANNRAGEAEFPQYADSMTMSPTRVDGAKGVRQELLAPTVYTPQQKKMRRSVPSDSDYTHDGSSLKQQDLDTPPTSASSTGTYNSGIDGPTRIKHLHEPTLQLLVGDVEPTPPRPNPPKHAYTAPQPGRDKLLPRPLPGSNHSSNGHSYVSSPRSVATENILELLIKGG